ncbi:MULTISPECIES: sigma-54 interaction domain-containing protein [unclassified Clostridioides]|uniref:sigma-54 interaction domain-containing protein n=1 Tax=unclassified Clostridioides TaxID=2635829 RepID=UPI0006BBDC6C|nr:ATPase AAA [Clostridioides difficile]MCC0690644.1 sigma 54-interacting transcriptional regulator [Clostridioides sp. ZZV14-6387]MCI9974497.1 sigma 54-interacting transcriptional regulator [Clostridioides difficile]MDB3083651.1 AAA family ATPase [Clostridioides difficile]MDI0264861.1 sigma 54-interacting transcriptional regulator [Clostridioides difficile]
MDKHSDSVMYGGMEVYNIWGTTTVDSIIGDSDVMRALKNRIRKIGNSDSTVAITGESGTGKELIARAIHLAGNRGNKTFVAINCAAIPEPLLESELFGYTKGAFSGADSKGKIGKFELANGGVVFLDEIGDMPIQLQSKLLRVLQEKKFTRIGSNELIDIDVRIISATNRDLFELVKENKFREDLYYRLNVIPLEVPPLRERGDDIQILINNFIDKYSRKMKKNVYHIEPDVEQMLLKYPWPGNIRELENTIELALNLLEEDGIIHKGIINRKIIEYFKRNNINIKLLEENDYEISMEQEILTLEEFERAYIKKVLKFYGNDTKSKKLAAKKLGISLATLYRKIDV